MAYTQETLIFELQEKLRIIEEEKEFKRLRQNIWHKASFPQWRAKISDEDFKAMRKIHNKTYNEKKKLLKAIMLVQAN